MTGKGTTRPRQLPYDLDICNDVSVLHLLDTQQVLGFTEPKPFPTSGGASFTNRHCCQWLNVTDSYNYGLSGAVHLLPLLLLR
jgi:hypothetical protein